MNTSHLDPLRQVLSTLPTTEPPPPWRRIGTVSIGGLRAIGFDRGSDLLLVVSSAGRGVIDCRTAKKVARDDSEYYEDDEAFAMARATAGPSNWSP